MNAEFYNPWAIIYENWAREGFSEIKPIKEKKIVFNDIHAV